MCGSTVPGHPMSLSPGALGDVLPASQRLSIDTIGCDFYKATIRYGFMESPDVPLTLMRATAG